MVANILRLRMSIPNVFFIHVFWDGVAPLKKPILHGEEHCLA
jgi:hypothetical protein